jgi:hypothetical protein
MTFPNTTAIAYHIKSAKSTFCMSCNIGRVRKRYELTSRVDVYIFIEPLHKESVKAVAIVIEGQ